MSASIASSTLTHRIAGLSQYSSIAGDSPARVYLVRAGIWPADPQISLPVSVSWVPHRLLKHTLPSGAVGAIMFSAWRAGELPRGLAEALVLRPLTLFGEPVGKRVVMGDPSGAVFEPREAPQRGEIHLCEHELDALALVRSEVTGSVRSPGAAERFKARLEAAGRTCTVRPPPFVPVTVAG